jgi:hypothetical protein
MGLFSNNIREILSKKNSKTIFMILEQSVNGYKLQTTINIFKPCSILYRK